MEESRSNWSHSMHCSSCGAQFHSRVSQMAEFEDALRKLHGKDADISEEAVEIQECIKTLQILPKARVQDLFGREYFRPVLVGVSLMELQNFGGYNGISYYTSETVVSAGFSSGDLGTILMGAIQIPITAVGAIFMDKSGRRPLLMVSALGTFIGCFLAAISFYLKVLLTPTHLAIVMEYASGGELSERICNAGRFSEDEARFFFQQLISGVSYCHSMVCSIAERHELSIAERRRSHGHNSRSTKATGRGLI